MQPIFPGLFRDVVDSVFRSLFINEIISSQIILKFVALLVK